MQHSRPPAALSATAATLVLTWLAWGVDARRRARRYALVHRTMVELLLNTLCAGDSTTARHSRRVAALTDVLGRTYRLDREGRARLRVGALLHDLGKLDDDVSPLVRSPHPLNDRERSQVEEHTDQSADILLPLESLHPGISRIVKAHHERWDGTGYPHGLRGEDIPLESRIISVADVFDALTQPRPYHDPVDPRDALERLRVEAGTTFDPDVIARVSRAYVWEEWVNVAREGRREEDGES